MKHVWKMKPIKVKGDAHEACLEITLTKTRPYYAPSIGQTEKYLVELLVTKRGYLTGLRIIERGEGKYKAKKMRRKQNKMTTIPIADLIFRGLLLILCLVVMNLTHSWKKLWDRILILIVWSANVFYWFLVLLILIGEVK